MIRQCVGGGGGEETDMFVYSWMGGVRGQERGYF